MEFTGCVYETPCASKTDVEWRVDAKSGSRYPIDLTRAELAGMELVGLPVRVEHMDRPEHKSVYNNEVGTVTGVSTDPATGKTDVTYVLHDNTAGLVAKTLTKNGTIKDLSLNHSYFPDTQAVVPVEISLCAQGARKGTHIYKQPPIIGIKASANDTPTANSRAPMASNEQTAVAAVTAPPQAMDASTSDQQPAAPEHGGEPAAAAAPAPEVAAPKNPPTGATHIEFLETIGDKVGDPTLVKELYDRVGNLMKYGAQKNESARELQMKLDVLEDANNRIKENNSQTAEQMIAVMNDLYRQFSPANVMSDNAAQEASKALVESPHLLKALQGVPVMASAITINASSKAQVDKQMQNDALQRQLMESKAAVALYEKQLGTMNSEVSLWAPSEQPQQQQQPQQQPQQQQQQPVQVAASGATLHHKRARTSGSAGLLPNWVREQCGNYQEASYQPQKIYGSDFEHPERMRSGATA